jgi:TctA family transporter
MIDLVNHLLLGFSTALLPINLMYCLVGAILGTLIASSRIGRRLPTPASALDVQCPAYLIVIMLAGIYYGASMAAQPCRSCSISPARLRLSSRASMAADGRQARRRGLKAPPGSLPRCVATVMITLFSFR